MEISKGGRRFSRAHGRRTEHAGNRRPDAPARHARPDGHEEHPRPQRRGPSLLPRKAQGTDDEDLKGDDTKEAEKNNEAARLWISGLEAVNRKLGSSRVIDLSATPFFLRGSGYAEGTLFPWTMSDFSLMDAIECGIVKLPRVPVAENIPGNEMPMFRNLWENIRKDMPKKGRGKAEELDPLKLPTRLQTALQALYGHYEKTFKLWEEAGIRCHPASSSSARTRPSPNWSTTSFPASTARTMMAPRRWRTAGCRCSATSTRHRQSAAASQHTADRQRTTRSRRRARQELPQHGGR